MVADLKSRSFIGYLPAAAVAILPRIRADSRQDIRLSDFPDALEALDQYLFF